MGRLLKHTVSCVTFSKLRHARGEFKLTSYITVRRRRRRYLKELDGIVQAKPTVEFLKDKSVITIMRSQHMTMAGEAGVWSDWFLKFVVTRTDVTQDLAVIFNHLHLPLQSVEVILEVLAVYLSGVPTSARRLNSTPRNQQANIISLSREPRLVGLW